jgi:ribosomal protein S18 acetylase RimI-like enzyme
MDHAPSTSELPYRAIAVATAANEDRSFDPQLIHAKRLRDRLAAIRTMQDIVRNTDNRVIGEIRQYNKITFCKLNIRVKIYQLLSFL